MKRMTSTHCVTSQSSFGPSLGWEELPRLGGEDSRFRARVWWQIIAGLVLFWGAVALAVVSWIG